MKGLINVNLQTDKKRAALFLISGFEETEALVTVDILRRGGVDVTTVSLGAEKTLTGRSAITVCTDKMFSEVENETFDMLVIPGGTLTYKDHAGLLGIVKRHHDEGKQLAAICAAPSVFGVLGLLSGRRAVIYPSLESWLKGAVICAEAVVTDGGITTAKGPGATMNFAFRLLGILHGEDCAKEAARDFIYMY